MLARSSISDLFTSEGSKEVVQIEGEEGAGKINMVFDRQQAGVR